MCRSPREKTATPCSPLALADRPRHRVHVHKLHIDHNHMLSGDTKAAVEGAHNALFKERHQIAEWLVENGLVPGGWHSHDGPPLGSPFAPAVAALRAHMADGLLALRHEGAESLAKRTELEDLDPEQRETFVSKVLAAVAVAVAAEHDEL